MARYQTVFGSLGEYEKGSIDVISDDPRHYVFSNIFEIAAKSPPYEKVAVARNLEYVIEAIRAEGTSPWYRCAHDEFVVVLDGEVRVELLKLPLPVEPTLPAKPMMAAKPASGPRPEDIPQNGTVRLTGDPTGQRMGSIRLSRGHQALLPAGAAYRFSAARPSAMIQQTLKGELTVEKWGEICFR
jgi:hypothetical protein